MPTANKKYRCTACSGYVRSSFEAFLHPLLKVLVCRKCHTDYGSGDFSSFNDPDIGPGVDENGDDNYCRWCVDGGDLFACSNGDLSGPDCCHYAFCTDCIKRNCPDDEVFSSDNHKWICFACNTDKLKKLRQEAQEIILALSSNDLKRPSKEQPPVVVVAAAAATTPIVAATSEADAPKRRKIVENESPKEPEANSTPSIAPPKQSESALRTAATVAATSEADAPKRRKIVENESPKEPEASSMPPIAPPKKPESALRRLSKKSTEPVQTNATAAPAATPASKTYSRSLPTSVNNINKTRLSGSGPPETSRINNNHLMSRPLSKQLKASNEHIKPSCRVPLSEIELKKRLDHFSKIKANCVKEIDGKFQNVLEMFVSKEISQNRAILKFEIEDLEKPIQEFMSMLRDLKSLHHSQNSETKSQ